MGRLPGCLRDAVDPELREAFLQDRYYPILEEVLARRARQDWSDAFVFQTALAVARAGDAAKQARVADLVPAVEEEDARRR